jgi:C_GCAxxG_C_C family probable redox protein
MTHSEKSAGIFDSGYNCAQAVLSAYSEKLNIENDLALKISSGFGGGMARMQETCGAVMAGIMVIGLSVSNLKEDIATNKERVYYMINLFIKKFKDKHGTIKCRELLNCNLNTDEGQSFYDTNELHDKICKNCVKDSVDILDELLKIS